MYDFQHEGKRIGGTTSLKRSNAAEYEPGQPLAIRYDPLNPGESKIDLGSDGTPNREHAAKAAHS